MARCGDAFRMSRSLMLGEEAGRFVAYERSISQRSLVVCNDHVSGLLDKPAGGRFVTKPGPCKRRIMSRHPALQLSTLRVMSVGDERALQLARGGRSPTSAGIDKRSDKP